MNRMRFGALLVNRQQQIALYLSHRTILAVPQPGCIRAITFEEFGRCQVLARNGVAITFVSMLIAAIDSSLKFQNSLQMVNFFLQRPENSSLADLYEYAKQKYGATLEDFAIRQKTKTKTSNH